jgi:hypothetical protein
VEGTSEFGQTARAAYTVVCSKGGKVQSRSLIGQASGHLSLTTGARLVDLQASLGRYSSASGKRTSALISKSANSISKESPIENVFMRASTLLRIASIISLLYCTGHSTGYPWTPVEGEHEMAIVESMKSHQFDVIGSMRSLWDFYIGFGLVVSGFMLAISVALWQLASLAKRGFNGIRPMILTFFIAFVINTIFEIRYFFVIPMVMAAAISVLLGIAFIITLRNRPEEGKLA